MRIRRVALALTLGVLLAVTAACPGAGTTKRSQCQEQVDTCIRRCNLQPERDEAANYRPESTIAGGTDVYAIRGRCEQACLDVCGSYNPSSSGLAAPATGPLDPSPPPPPPSE